MAKKATTKRTGRTRGTTKKGAAATPATRAVSTRDARLRAPGTTITRRYKGRELRVEVREDGFRFEGETFSSLTGAALRATGYKAISGPHFWGTDGHAAAVTKTSPTKRRTTGRTTDPTNATSPATTANAIPAS